MYFVTFWCGKCQTGSVVTVQSQFECGTIKIMFLVFGLKAIKTVSLTFSLPYLYSYISISSQKNYIRYMAVQYLQELMSIYKGTSMELLMKKSDFSAVELILWNNMTMAFLSQYITSMKLIFNTISNLWHVYMLHLYI